MPTRQSRLWIHSVYCLKNFKNFSSRGRSGRSGNLATSPPSNAAVNVSSFPPRLIRHQEIVLKHLIRFGNCVMIIQINGLIFEITLNLCVLFVFRTEVASGSINYLYVLAIVDLSAIKTNCNPSRTVIQTSSYFSCASWLYASRILFCE